MKWPSWCNLILGAWLIASPWLIGLARGVALANTFVVGVVVAIVAIVALSSVEVARGARWVNLFLGTWLIVSPWVLAYTAAGAATGNAVIAGALVTICAAVGLGTRPPLIA